MSALEDGMISMAWPVYTKRRAEGRIGWLDKIQDSSGGLQGCAQKQVSKADVHPAPGTPIQCRKLPLLRERNYHC